MKLFWAPQTRSQRAIWMLEETGIDYEMEKVALSSPDRADSAVFLRMFDMLPGTRNLDAYADRCLARPANQRAMEKGTA